MVNRLSPIEVSLSAQTLRFKPGGPPASFEVTVINASEGFATVVVDLDAPSVEDAEDSRWYRLYPEVGTKTPPGDLSQFTVEIHNNPVPGFVGTMNITVRVLFLELPEEEERQLIRLVVEPGESAQPLALSLPVPSFAVRPQSELTIPVELYNPGPVPVAAVLTCQGLPPTWAITLPQGLPPIKPGDELETVIHCQIPVLQQAPSQPYPFTVTASQGQGISSRVEGEVHVLPQGYYGVEFFPLEQDVPGDRTENARALPPASEPMAIAARDAALFEVAVENVSNLPQEVSLLMESDTLPADALAVLPDTVPLPLGETAYLRLQVAPKRPLLGWPRVHNLTARAKLSAPQLEIRNDTETLRLWVKPRIPFLLQLLGLLGLVALLLLPFLPRSEGHKGPVNQLQFSGDADRVFSGSSDQTLRQWQLQRNRLRSGGVLARPEKAVRVVELRPVRNDLLAIGLENGEISLWDVLSDRREPLSVLVDEQANRVLDLEFSADASTLFSSHGGGEVLQWTVGSFPQAEDPVQSPTQTSTFNFAVYALARVGQQGQQLAVAGRYNRLVLWNWQTDERFDLLPTGGNQNDYIQSLATPDRFPNYLAAADNQGGIQLWDVSNCVPTARAECATLLEAWNTGHEGRPVRSLAYTPDGCYLVSVGDDRRVMLWPLEADGRRDPRWQEGKVVRRSRQKLNTVAAILNGGQILLSSGGDDHRVQLDTLKSSSLRQSSSGRCDATR